MIDTFHAFGPCALVREVYVAGSNDKTVSDCVTQTLVCFRVEFKVASAVMSCQGSSCIVGLLALASDDVDVDTDSSEVGTLLTLSFIDVVLSIRLIAFAPSCFGSPDKQSPSNVRLPRRGTEIFAPYPQLQRRIAIRESFTHEIMPDGC